MNFGGGELKLSLIVCIL